LLAILGLLGGGNGNGRLGELLELSLVTLAGGDGLLLGLSSEEEPKEEKKEEKAAAKSRSQSRKRTSIFGTLLGKKDAEEKTPSCPPSSPQPSFPRASWRRQRQRQAW
jgi:hypothetical protein